MSDWEKLVGLAAPGNEGGLYAFELALHVFSAHTAEEWNAQDGWRSGFPNLDPDWWFFAEDVFADQFFRTPTGEVGVFRAEEGEAEMLAPDIEGWAEMVLGDFEVWTGHPVAHEWQKEHGRLAEGERLTPKIPFVLGGSYELDNLYAASAVEIMAFRASLAAQVESLSDGTEIRLVHE
ncbi:hypothetical protein [Allokutzneria sp. NRRL B-24872]|uniref:hypothetical protein n=1 Tax=Allokutzneria sp. NRRL B-24872 TaxID=1137961 RepID=UPI000A368F28|nr:hypothetical protein [Allokutzneria sp. NRRL B-24872]